MKEMTRINEACRRTSSLWNLPIKDRHSVPHEIERYILQSHSGNKVCHQRVNKSITINHRLWERTVENGRQSSWLHSSSDISLSYLLSVRTNNKIGYFGQCRNIKF